MSMQHVLEGGVTKVTDSRLRELQTIAKDKTQREPGTVSWMHWHWLAVLNELVELRAENETLRKLRDTLTEECGSLEDRLQEERRSQEATKKEIHRAYHAAMEAEGMLSNQITRVMVQAAAEMLMTAVGQATGVEVCTVCSGTGFSYGSQCEQCSGKGR